MTEITFPVVVETVLFTPTLFRRGKVLTVALIFLFLKRYLYRQRQFEEEIMNKANITAFETTAHAEAKMGRNNCKINIHITIMKDQQLLQGTFDWLIWK